MKKVYRMPEAHTVSFSVNENIASSIVESGKVGVQGLYTEEINGVIYYIAYCGGNEGSCDGEEFRSTNEADLFKAVYEHAKKTCADPMEAARLAQAILNNRLN
jgi:hypothetical protein